MSIVCPSCGRANADDARFCSGCATELVAAPLAREERKVVTVLFCDLVGSTARAEGADPEDVRVMLSAYHDRVRNELERFGGTVEKFIGDAVMALFGAPAAHDDDPERAVRAALAIRDWAIEAGDLQVRIGITTGEALVSLGARAGGGRSHGCRRRGQHCGAAAVGGAGRAGSWSARPRTARPNELSTTPPATPSPRRARPIPSLSGRSSRPVPAWASSARRRRVSSAARGSSKCWWMRSDASARTASRSS